MRELKFKAWHIEQKQMYWFDLMWGNHGKGDGYIGMVEWGMPRDSPSSYSGNQTLIDPNNCELMQYTGLKDKNGVEIYEGDIIIAANGTKQEIKFGAWEMRFTHHAGTDRVNGIGFSFSGDEPFSESFGNPYEVIGNIYETPDLLTTKN